MRSMSTGGIAELWKADTSKITHLMEGALLWQSVGLHVDAHKVKVAAGHVCLSHAGNADGDRALIHHLCQRSARQDELSSER